MEIIRASHPYYLCRDTKSNQVAPYAVFIKTEHGFYQQVSKWYMHKGWCFNAYTKLLKEATKCILNNDELAKLHSAQPYGQMTKENET